MINKAIKKFCPPPAGDLRYIVAGLNIVHKREIGSGPIFIYESVQRFAVGIRKEKILVPGILFDHRSYAFRPETIHQSGHVNLVRKRNRPGTTCIASFISKNSIEIVFCVSKIE